MRTSSQRIHEVQKRLCGYCAGQICGPSAVPRPSERLSAPITCWGKLIREALEDSEYMTLAGKQGHKAQVDEIVDSLARSFGDWSRSPEPYMAARAKLAALIAAE